MVSTWVKEKIVGLITFYQKNISPLKPPSCRFYPSCSAYTIQALNRYGILKGSRRALWRILRCNPFHPGGFDPLD